MLESISLKFTETQDLIVPAKGVTVFVGPNNSGKSLILRELELAISSSVKVNTKLLNDFEIIWPSN
jgi:predicted ATP-dependent endonuclease of OLD family